MDATDYPSLARLARASAQLAVHNLRVEAVVAAQLDDFERLFRAARSRDWEVVLRVSEALAARPRENFDTPVVRTARKVCQALGRDPTGEKAVRPLGELLTACRAAQLKK